MMAFAFNRASAGFLFFVAAAASLPAQAQNFDSAGLLRFGAFVEGSWTNFDTRRSPDIGLPEVSTGSLTSDGWGGGLSFGYDLLLPSSLVVGLEVDGAAEDSRAGSGLRDVAVNYLVTVRGRLGSYLRPDLMIYATGGLALLGVEHHGPFDIAIGERLKAQRTLPGWTVGAGIEYEWYEAIFFAEYLFASYGEFSVRESIGTHFDADVDQNVLRLGVKFKIGYDFLEHPVW